MRGPLCELHLQERWETCGAEYVQGADGKAAAPAVSVQVNATGDAQAASQRPDMQGDTEKDDEHRVRPAVTPAAHDMLPLHASLSHACMSPVGLTALLHATMTLTCSEKTSLLQVKRFIPFSIGPRDCIGQNLAKVNYQTTVPMLLSQFSFKLAEEVLTPPSHAPIGHLLYAWIDYYSGSSGAMEGTTVTATTGMNFALRGYMEAWGIV